MSRILRPPVSSFRGAFNICSQRLQSSHLSSYLFPYIYIILYIYITIYILYILIIQSSTYVACESSRHWPVDNGMISLISNFPWKAARCADSWRFLASCCEAWCNTRKAWTVGSGAYSLNDTFSQKQGRCKIPHSGCGKNKRNDILNVLPPS